AIPLNYEAEFENAKLTFRHQRVYDPKAQKIVSLTPLPESVELSTSDGTALDFLGPILSDDIGRAIAEGDMDPITLERFGPNMVTSALAHDLDAQGDEADLPESPSAVDADFVASWTNRRRQVLPIAFGTVNVLAVILSHLVINSCL
uniref:Uncharacterized protein n=1 Tax=Globisporangium ultimum (strain ATCC 200006 / CBS 805.95 / DAOM BR144) TaxID=431595 RepID=K3X2F3_GLOUD